MDLIRYTLLADGTSDEVLLPIIDWLMAQHCPAARIVSVFARDIGPVGNDLLMRVPAALRNFPCDILFVHRDAERMAREDRLREINEALVDTRIPVVPIVPIRMTEAWLLADEGAIRFASGNASGRNPLNLPAKRQWESLPDPKEVLREALLVASGRTGRALGKFRPERVQSLITRRSESFHALRGLSAFDAFERDLKTQLQGMA